MKISEMIASLQAALVEHGDLEIQSVVPEGPYARCEGPFEYMGVGYMNDEGEFLDNEEYSELVEEAEDVGDDVSHIEGPFYCIGALPVAGRIDEDEED